MKYLKHVPGSMPVKAKPGFMGMMMPKVKMAASMMGMMKKPMKGGK